MFLADPVRAPEWKDILRDFDRCYGVAGSAPPQTAATETPIPEVDWTSIFPDVPQFSESKVKAKYAFAGVQGVTCYVVEPADYDGETGGALKYELWVAATCEATIPGTIPLLTYGAGSWLLDGKAETALRETPEKVIAWKFNSCTAQVVLEDGALLHASSVTSTCIKPIQDVKLEEEGSDSELMTLLQLVQKIERMGHMDIAVSGHVAERPPEVVQGSMPDTLGSQFLP